MEVKDIITMTIKEAKRIKMIEQILAKQITQKHASEILGISDRHIRRIVKSYRAKGAQGIPHKSRGRISNRKTPEKIQKKTLKLYEKNYSDFGPTLATEKLKERDGIDLSPETLRQWLIQKGLWTRKRKKVKHRRWRARKAMKGEMVQIDGSHHDWLEGRGPELVLMGYIDDASNITYGRFYDYEGTQPAMDSFKGYVRKYGLPHSVYLDRHSTYKSTKKLTASEEIEGLEPMSQFERALKELGVTVIHAHSPQAKGRVERLFGTLQDRLVKEMRLANIKTKDEANQFLAHYLPIHNKKFSLLPLNPTDMHIKPIKSHKLDQALCIKEERTVRKDNTISINNQLYQLTQRVTSKKVAIEHRLDGSLRVISRGKSIKYKQIFHRPVIDSQVSKLKKKKASCIPSKDHPWRRWDKKKSSRKEVLAC